MTSKVSLPAGVRVMDAPAGFDARKAAELLLAVGPSRLLAPVGTPLADPLIALEKTVREKNPIQLAPAANRSVQFGPVPWASAKPYMNYASAADVPEVPQTVQPGSFKLAQGLGAGTPAAPGHQPERSAQAQPERSPLTADERDAGEHSASGTEVAQWLRENFGKGPVPVTPKQKGRRGGMEAKWNQLLAQARAIDPNYFPPPVMINRGTYDGELKRLEYWIEETEKWLLEQRRQTVPANRLPQKESDRPMREYRPRFRGLLDPPL